MKKVLILFGGNSFEHDISCRSVNFIIDNIDKTLFDYSLVGIDKSNNWYQVLCDKVSKDWFNEKNKRVDNIIEYVKTFDDVFPMIHGNGGEDGKLQGLFELYNIKYVGCNSFSSLVCYDKYLTKLVVEKIGVPQVEYYRYEDMDKISYPVIVKPCKCGSSIGINVCDDIESLKECVENAYKYDDNVVIEKFIKNKRELECAVLESGDKLIVSNVGEIVVDGWYDFDSKYVNETKTCISNIDEDVKNLVREYSVKIFKSLNCKGFSRVDFLYDVDTKQLYFNEINTIPGFTSISMYPQLIKEYGIEYSDLITRLLSI